MSVKFRVLGGGGNLGLGGGGGSADFIFMGAGIFLKKGRLSIRSLARISKKGPFYRSWPDLNYTLRLVASCT